MPEDLPEWLKDKVEQWGVSGPATGSRTTPIRLDSERPTVKSAESEECQCHAEKESGEDSEPYDRKSVATGLRVAAMSGRRDMKSTKA